MSVVTSIVIICPMEEGAEEFIARCERRIKRLELVASSLYTKPYLVRLNEHCGGPKAPQMEIWGTSINCFEWRKFLDFFCKLNPSKFIHYKLIMHYEHWDNPLAFYPGMRPSL